MLRSRTHGAIGLALLLSLAVLPAGSPLAAGPTIAPGETSDPLWPAPADCTGNAGRLDTNLPCPQCITNCTTLNDGYLATQAFLGAITRGHYFATSSISTDFTISDTPEASGEPVACSVNYDVRWNGFVGGVVFFGGGQASARISLILTDLTTNTTVKRELIHENEPWGLSYSEIEAGGLPDEGRFRSSFVAMGHRGHSYRASLQIYVEALQLATTRYDVDYWSGQKGAWWTDLRVTVANDPIELTANLQKQIDDLRYRLEHHGHQYLTGRGEGHNNTVATTGASIFFDDSGAPGDDADDLLGPLEGKEALPRSSALYQSYPNPAHPGATIGFALPIASHVTIKLYNVSGMEVATLLDAERSSGEHRLPIDVSGLASGTYFYRLVAGNFAESRKLVVLK